MLLTKEVKVKWNSKNKLYYESLGYVYPHKWEEFIIPIEHLYKESAIKVEVQCDCCGTILYRRYAAYLKDHDDEFGDVCRKCAMNTKYVRTCTKKYGVKNAFQTEDFQEKSKQTRLERYGNENYRNAEQAKQTKLERYGDENYNNIEQNKQTCLERYGVEYALQSEEVRAKGKQTKFERYGDENYVNVEQIKQTKFERYGDENYNNREQAWKTTLKHYGVEKTFSSPKIFNKAKQTKLERYGDENYNNRPKSIETKINNGTYENYFSKPHQYLYGLLCGLYGTNKVKLESPLEWYSLDCELTIDGIKIDVEYNGSYWHNGNEKHDNKRRKFVLSQGYKIFNINSGAKFPTAEQVENAINTLTTTDMQIITIDLDT